MHITNEHKIEIFPFFHHSREFVIGLSSFEVTIHWVTYFLALVEIFFQLTWKKGKKMVIMPFAYKYQFE